MLPIDPAALPLSLNLGLFVLAAAVVWIAGTRMSRYAELVSVRTGLGRAFIGALLLGGMTSLPEGVTTIAASAIGNAPLAVNNLFGGVAMQVAILAAADLFHRSALTSHIRDPTVTAQAGLLVLVLLVGVAGISVGDRLAVGVGLWTSVILVITIASFYLIHRIGARQKPPETRDAESPSKAKRASLSNTGLTLRMLAGAIAILLGGSVVAQTGDALALQTSLGSAFVGAVLVAISTSLPEISTTFGAIRISAYAMAFSNIFGANLLDMSILFLADAVYPGEPVLNLVGLFSIVAVLLGAALTAVYLIRLLRPSRRKRRVGLDSIVVLSLYAVGLVVLYFLR